MDPTPDRPAEARRVDEIRLEIELAKVRIVETIDALEHKADVPARLADALSATASNITAHILQRIPSASRTSRATEGVGEEASLAQPSIDDALNKDI